jgi:hypothetical protein
MPFSGNVYTPPLGAENAVPGAVLQSAIWNSIFTDMAAALTQLATQANTTPTWSNIMAPNGGFSVWQRGSGSTSSFAINASTTAYTADRWYIITGANQASVVAAATGLTAAAPTAHAAKITRNNAQTGITAMTFAYPLTLDEVNRIRGQQVSFSGAAKAGANWSPTNGTLTISLLVGTGAAQKAGLAGVNFTNLTTPLAISVNLAASASNLAISGTSAGAVAGTATQGELQVTWTPTGTAGADDSITLDQFCLVAGTIVQSFEDIPFDISLRECKRFYRKSFPYGTAPATAAGLAGSLGVMSAAAAPVSLYVQFEPVELYATAAITTYNPVTVSAAWWDADGSATLAATIENTSQGPKGQFIYSATAAAAVRRIFIHYSADAGI